MCPGFRFAQLGNSHPCALHELLFHVQRTEYLTLKAPYTISKLFHSPADSSSRGPNSQGPVNDFHARRKSGLSEGSDFKPPSRPPQGGRHKSNFNFRGADMMSQFLKLTGRNTGVERWFRTTAIVLLLVFAAVSAALGQAGFDDDRVMLQGFYWESYRHGYPAKFSNYGDKHWYMIIQNLGPAIRAARFDLIWLPPPSYTGDSSADKFSAGYNPKQYFRL